MTMTTTMTLHAIANLPAMRVTASTTRNLPQSRGCFHPQTSALPGAAVEAEARPPSRIHARQALRWRSPRQQALPQVQEAPWGHHHHLAILPIARFPGNVSEPVRLCWWALPERPSSPRQPRLASARPQTRQPRPEEALPKAQGRCLLRQEGRRPSQARRRGSGTAPDAGQVSSRKGARRRSGCGAGQEGLGIRPVLRSPPCKRARAALAGPVQSIL